MDISSINPIRTNLIGSATPSTQPTTPTDNVTKSFGDVLNALNQSQQTTDDLTSQLAAGGDVDLSTLMIASEENDINFRVTIAIRDRLVDAYREVMRMSI